MPEVKAPKEAPAEAMFLEHLGRFELTALKLRFQVKVNKNGAKLGCAVESLLKEYCIVKRVDPGSPLKDVKAFDRVLKAGYLEVSSNRQSYRGGRAFREVSLKRCETVHLGHATRWMVRVRAPVAW